MCLVNWVVCESWLLVNIARLSDFWLFVRVVPSVKLLWFGLGHAIFLLNVFIC